MDHSADWLTSYEALKSVYSDGAYSNMALNEAIPRHRGCRDSFVRNLVKETIRQTITLDYIIGMLASSGLKGIRTRTLIILRMGLCAIREMDSVPDHAAVNEAVSLARKKARGTDRFVNAVLRGYLRRRAEFEPAGSSDGSTRGSGGSAGSRTGITGGCNGTGMAPFIESISDPSLRLSVQYSMPVPVAELIQEQYGDQAEDILRGLNQPTEVILRVNTLKTTREELISALEDTGIRAEALEGSERAVAAHGRGLMDSDLYRNGYFTVQSLSSMIAVEALGPAPGSTVLDMCAAPGGKSTMMAEMMENRGSITACDIHEHRLDLIRAAAARTGTGVVDRQGITSHGIIDAALMDGTVYDSDLEGLYEYVLADVPCSGLGVMSTKPEIRLRTDVSAYDELTGVQLDILKNAYRYAKNGARICYSTCTINRNENEGVIRRFMKWLETTDGSSAPADNGFVRIVEMNTILPYNNLIGFYYCILEKNA